VDVIIASDPDPEVARAQHYLLFDATEYVRAAYASSVTYLPLGIGNYLAEWEDTRRNLGATPEEMHQKLIQARTEVENAPHGIGLDETRDGLLASFDSLGVGVGEASLAEDASPSA
jgi:hypothetical protein